MPCVILESPYAGDLNRNIRYARQCMRNCLMRGEAPFASHLLYTQPHVLRDSVQEERAMGIAAGFQWGAHADYVVAYIDYGITPGMKQGIRIYQEQGLKVIMRTLEVQDKGNVHGC